MKLRRQYAWLFAGPLTLVSGCGIGSMSGLAQRESIISLERPDPLTALQRSTEMQSEDADEGVLSRANWFRRSDEPEEQRLMLLTGSRRRMNQQMMSSMMMPMLMQSMQGSQPTPAPTHPGGASKSGTSTGGAQPTNAATTPQLTLPQMMMPGMMTPEMMAAGASQSRRGFRGLRSRSDSKESRSEAKLEREENSATTEADRIERAAQAEAERAEKAAIAEATVAERRLLAEAELAERLTRAELELAERLAAAKDERDRRLAMAREERDLRMAILGIDTGDLDSDPVDEALARLDGTKKSSTGADSGRFSRFLRPWSNDSDADAALADSRSTSKAAAEPASEPTQRAAGSEQQDIIARTLDHSDALLDRPSIAEYASSRPAEFPSIVRPDDGIRSGNDLITERPSATDDYDGLLAREAIAKQDRAPEEDWSLLENFVTPKSEKAESIPSRAPEFPLFAASQPDQAVAPESRVPESLASAEGGPRSDRRSPEDDLWILGGSANRNPGVRVEEVDDTSEYTEPGGLFARNEPTEPTPAVVPDVERPVDTGSPPAFPTAALASFNARAELASAPVFDPAGLGPASADPWSDQQLAAASTTSNSDAPVFDWSRSAQEQVNQVVHQPLPAIETPVRNAAWVHQSLRDVCGQLPADIEALVIQLDIPESGVRKAVLEDLARLGAKSQPAVPAIRVLLDDSPLVAAHAAWTLWRVEENESETVRELVRLLQTGEPETVQFTAYALGSMGAKALNAAPALRSERERFNGPTRVHVAEALTRIDAFDQASVEVLMYGLQHPETHVRWLSALALGEVQKRYAQIVAPALTSSLKDSDAEVRSASALSLGGFGKSAESAVPELQSRATLDAPSVQEAAQTALACILK